MGLESLFGSSKDRIQEKVEEYYKKGLSYIESKMYTKALFEFKQALEMDKENVYQRLKDDLDNFSRFGQMEAALAVGLNILQENQGDAQLANQLGNFSRQLSNYKQANNLYKHALKKDKKFEYPFYNLAASMARVNKYDDDVIRAIDTLKKYTDYVLPSYIGGTDLIEQISEEILDKKKNNVDEKIQVLTLEIEEKKHSLNTQDSEIDSLQKQIDFLKANRNNVVAEDILSFFIDQLQTESGNANDIFYNQGLYALSVHKSEIAAECFVTLLKGNAKMKYLRMNLAIANAQKGNYEEATNSIVRLLGEDRYDRFYNINLGLMYKQMGKKLLSFKYLVLSAWLLEESDGIFNMNEMLQLADSKFEDERYKDALKLYRVIVNEENNAQVWGKIGEIYIKINNFDDAVTSFRKVLEFDPESQFGKSKLQEIHDFYVDKAEDLNRDLKYKPALKNFLKALEVERSSETLNKTISVCRQMKRHDLEKQLTEELEKIKEKEKEKAKENERLEIIETATMAMKQKNYIKAIEYFEKAFRMRLDKEIFIQLAGLYKGLKKTGEMDDLLQRWNKMVEYDEKMKKFQKLQDRSSNADKDDE